ncbi:alpha/beta fold hydrolase [Novosphingobium sp. KACC 22771]|uniref:alpha/beta fold hydrolase n=1 Tax=Novosphingobium sp. KACC 22771 TaxID=3025670 RepID=UPI0023653D48|nr:alpha/beta hydrolase [Novosphingobium sp. KACC 22771]WDF74868.1 alpha/beta hydrolase [Novosphingobium sp. KACC 22771]
MIGALAGLVLAGALAAPSAAETPNVHTDRAAVVARWAAAPSRFVTVDGVPIHVREEGRKGAPVVVLLHGSIVNLHEWDLVVPLLTRDYRVVRFDWSPYGLSGPDPKGVYTTPRAAELMDGLMRKLGHDRFALVSTSNGANVALEYNRAYPGHVTAMAFSILPLERPSQTRKIGTRMMELVAEQKAKTPQWRSHAYFREVLKDTTPPGFEPQDWMVDSIFDADNLPGAYVNQAALLAANVELFKTDIVKRETEAVTVPVLLQWCTYDTVISQSAAESRARFPNAQVDYIEYPTLGHFPMWENPKLFTRDLKAFLDRQRKPAARRKG